jgi:flagellar assembly factor FliW
MSALTFTEPLLGLAPHREFTLDEIPGAPGLFSLTAVDDASVRLHVISADVYLPEYRPELPTDAARALGFTSDPLLLVVTNLTAEGPQVNLLAPIAMNRSSGAALQVILDGDYPLRAVLTELLAAS